MPEHLKAGSEFPPVDPKRLRLYTMVFCPFANRVELVLAHHKIDHEVVCVDLKEKPEWFLSRISTGKVPAIELNGEVMVESDIISLHLDKQQPENSLAAASGQEKIDAALKWWSEAYPAQRQLAVKKEDVDDSFMKSLKNFEKMVGDPFISGSKVGLADYLVYPVLGRLEAFYRLAGLPMPRKEDLPVVYAWVAAMRALPAVAKLSISQDRQYRFFASYFAGSPDYSI